MGPRRNLKLISFIRFSLVADMINNKFINDVNRFSSNPTEENMSILCQIAKETELETEEIACLAKTLANSGHRFSRDNRFADIPSTGGPSSLSTLICPLQLRINGFKILKITVPGRPAGGIDVLAQIPNYKVSLAPIEINQSLKKSGYVHVLADSNFVPLDAKLFNFRKRSGFIAIPSLVIASILAKKLAAGVKYVGLDVRVGPHGNFGDSLKNAHENAIKFIDVSLNLGIKSCCFLTNGSNPFQPYIGRGESLLALYDMFEMVKYNRLRKHIEQCDKMVMVLSRLAGLNHKKYDPNVVFNEFKYNLVAQGSSPDDFAKQVDNIKNSKRYDLVARCDGYPIIDMQKIRATIGEYQGNKSSGSKNDKFPDSCGLELCYEPGSIVTVGTVLARVRCAHEDWINLEMKLQKCFEISNMQPPNQFFEVVENA